MNSYQDDELNLLLKPLKDLEPSPLQVQRWKKSTRASQAPQHWKLQLVAATIVGLALGMALMHWLTPESEISDTLAQISSSNATFEIQHSNLD